MINNVFVFNPVRPDFIGKAIETLYKFTDGSFKVVLIDQTKHGLFENWDKWKDMSESIHLYLRPHRNLGFAKSMNEGIIHGLRWKSGYITCCNDDIEFIDSRWWDGILETFNQDERIIAANPMSPKEPGWGYGLPHGEYVELIEYKSEFTKEDYNYLLKGDFSALDDKLPKSFPRQKQGVIDAIATWCTVFKREAIKDFGLFDERFYPGGAEDYDYNGRVYRKKKRMVGTTRSWVWHHWGSSKDKGEEFEGLPVIQDLVWADTSELWPKKKNNGQSFDPWGHWTDDGGKKHPMYRVPEIGIVEI